MEQHQTLHLADVGLAYQAKNLLYMVFKRDDMYNITWGGASLNCQIITAKLITVK